MLIAQAMWKPNIAGISLVNRLLALAWNSVLVYKPFVSINQTEFDIYSSQKSLLSAKVPFSNSVYMPGRNQSLSHTLYVKSKLLLHEVLLEILSTLINGKIFSHYCVITE